MMMPNPQRPPVYSIHVDREKVDTTTLTTLTGFSTSSGYGDVGLGRNYEIAIMADKVAAIRFVTQRIEFQEPGVHALQDMIERANRESELRSLLIEALDRLDAWMWAGEPWPSGLARDLRERLDRVTRA